MSLKIKTLFLDLNFVSLNENKNSIKKEYFDILNSQPV